MSKLQESRHEAEQQIDAAKVKMDVLSSYFKEKERELNRFCFHVSFLHVLYFTDIIFYIFEYWIDIAQNNEEWWSFDIVSSTYPV